MVTLAPPVLSVEEPAPSASVKKGMGKPADASGLRACCAALKSNAASMPPPNNVYAENAAAYCSASVASINTPGQKDAFILAIRGALRGAAVPAQCK